MDKKRLIFIIIFIIACVLIGYALYRMFFAKPKPAAPAAPGKVTYPAGQLPAAGIGEIAKPAVTPAGQLPAPGEVTLPAPLAEEKPLLAKQTLDTAVLNPARDIGGAAKFYNKIDGKFYRMAKDGIVKELTDQIFYNVDKITWSPVKEQAILEYPDGANIYYDFASKKQATLPKHWEEFSFSPLGDKVAAKSIGLSPENRWLITFDPDGKNITLVEPMGENQDKVNVDWSPNKQIVALSLTGEELGDDRQEVLFVGLHGENFRSTIVEGRGLVSQWSPSGKKLLYSVYSARNDFKPELWIVNAEGDTIGTGRKMLGLNTWGDKCAFADERFIYCAVPTKLDTGAGFAPDLANYTPDKIYKIDLQTDLKTEIPIESGHTIDSMFVSADGKTLNFTDKNQAGLFSVNL